MTAAPPSPLALVTALAVERRALQPLLREPRRLLLDGHALVQGRRAEHAVILIQAGMGPERARAAARLACQRFGCQAVWSVGLAGGLAAGLESGHLVVPATVLAAHGEAAAPVLPGPDPRGLERLQPPPAPGPLLTVSRPLLTPAEKRAWRQRTGALAVDMEAAGVGQAAAELGLPWRALKAVLDAVDHEVPAFLATATSAEGDIAWRRLAAALRSPARLRAAMALARASRIALAALAAGLAALLDAAVTLTPSQPSIKITH